MGHQGGSRIGMGMNMWIRFRQSVVIGWTTVFAAVGRVAVIDLWM